MENSDQLKEMEDQLEKLSAQLQQQYKEVQALRQQLQALTPTGPTAATSSQHTSLSSRLLTTSALENLIGLRLIHLVGIVVLVIGLSLGVKYAIDKELISENMRILLAYLAGGVLYFFSVRLKKAYAGFSAILLSGAMASLYFTTYGALVYYHLLSYTLAFLLMGLFTIFTTFEALRYNRQEIALLGLVGAYAIPFLISPNRGQPELLFLYITVINLGVLFLCARRPWHFVGRAAQAISWLIFIGWAAWQNDEGIRRYGLIFMGLFFALFALNALSPKLFQKAPLSRNNMLQLLTNNAAAYVAALFVFGYSFENSTVAFISLAFAILAAVQAVGFRVWREETASRLLTNLALLLFVLFIGFQWKGITVTLLWLATAVAVFVAGVRLRSTPLRLAAIVLMGVTLVKLVLLDSLTFTTLQKVIAYLVLGVLLLAIAFFYQKTSPPAPPQRSWRGESPPKG